MFDPTDNPYMPRNQQNMRLAIDPNDLAFPRPIPAAHAPAMLVVSPMNEREMAYGDEDDDDDVPIHSPIILDPIQDHEFPAYFRQMGSPPRLFHSHGSYVLPVDSDETKRQEAQHILLRMIIGSNYDAPIPIRELLNSNTCGRQVVDICTGAGHWVLEMAHEFPHVQFSGLDLVPIQTRYPPDNVLFEIADVTDRLNFEDASVDVVHARMTCLSADAIPGFLREVARILRPGGLFLSAEWDTHPTLHPEHPWSPEIEGYIPETTQFYDFASAVVPTHAQDISRLIHQNGAFERPVLKRRAIPISAPHASGSYGLHFVSQVMERVTQGYADALVAGRCVPPAVADSFKQELSERSGIVGVYQTVIARKSRY